ncbi:MAG: type III-A CRISPR-associated protein Csm2 [Deltaproteobacteria bacterium]|nr:MAG: type III-A CRISPR-associated protein Csm2 [Deltaproteobacteria bacterium]
MALPNAQTIKEIIKGDTKKLVQEAERMGEHFRNLKAKRKELTTSQIRNVFGSVKKMEMKGFDANELRLLKPKLAYAAYRPGAKDGTRDLRTVLSTAIDCVEEDKEKFENFCNFFEAILAYHRAAGGK